MGEPLPHHRLPLLTEVVADGQPVSLPLPVLTEAEPAPAAVRPVPVNLPVLTEPVTLPPPPQAVATAAAGPAPDLDEARIVDAVLQGLHPRIDLMFEYRLRETLTPLLARLADSLVQDVRHDLSQTLRDVVARAVAQELARRRSP